MSFPKKSKVYDSNDDTSNETFVGYGTELPDISSEQDSGKYVPLWKQEVLIFFKYFFLPWERFFIEIRRAFCFNGVRSTSV